MAPSDLKPVEELKTPVGRLRREFDAKPITGGYSLNTGYRVMADNPGKRNTGGSHRFALLDLDGNEVVFGVTIYKALQHMQSIQANISNVVQVTPRLWVGGDPLYSTSYPPILMDPSLILVDTRSQYERVDGWDEIVATYNRTATVIHQPMLDDGHSKNNVTDFLDLNNQLFGVQGHRRERPVFVHCHMGINRSPSVVFFMMTAMGYYHGTPKTAYKRLRAVRPEAGIKYSPEALDAGLRLTRAGMGARYRDQQLDEWGQWLDEYWTDVKYNAIRAEVRKRRDWARGQIYNAGQFNQYLEVSNER